MNNEVNETLAIKCGIIMPISEIDGCSEIHWREVKNILSDAINDAGFVADLVSETDNVGIIQKTIIQNIYENPIVVCDVSGKNPNVMFELGMRLAFDKPTIIVKDDQTNYSFDTSPIEHLTYPRDLRFSKIVEFKNKLSGKIKGTFERANSDPSYTTFLKNFGEFTIPRLDTKEVSKEDYILEELKQLKRELNLYARRQMDIFENNERAIYREKDVLRDIEEIILMEMLNLKQEGKGLEINEAKKSITSLPQIRDLANRVGISNSTLRRIIDRAFSRTYPINEISNNIVG